MESGNKILNKAYIMLEEMEKSELYASFQEYIQLISSHISPEMAGVIGQVIENGLPIAAGILGFFRPLDAAKIISGVLIGGGACGLLFPVGTAKVFGVPFADPLNSLFFPGIGGRNLAAGLMILLLSFGAKKYEGFDRALGVVLGCWTCAGFSDTWILVATAGTEKVLEHLRNVCVLAVVSWRLLTLPNGNRAGRQHQSQ